MQKILTRAWLVCLIAGATIGILFGSLANAQNGSPLGVPVPARPAIGQPAIPPAELNRHPQGVIASASAWVFETQQRLNRELAGSVRALKGDNPVQASALLIAIAFAYGVLHAAGPGHGKAVISSYVLANHDTVRRGIALSFLAAIVQGLTAVVFVAVLAVVLKQTSVEMRATEGLIESLSWALIAAVGAWLLWRQLRALRMPSQPVGVSPHAEIIHPASHSAHGADCGCGHSHMPSPALAARAWSWREALPIALSIGIRPCSGAIILLIFALSQGMLWAGLLGTFAMALGTAITVSALAILAVSSRDWASRISGEGSVWASRIATGAGLLGATLVFLLGTAFFIASLTAGSPF